VCSEEEHGCEGNIGDRSYKRQWRCVFVEEHGSEGNIGRTLWLIIVEVFFFPWGGLGCPFDPSYPFLGPSCPFGPCYLFLG
jgi:hypothetical protein